MSRAQAPEVAGPVYLDASGLAKLYLAEPGSVSLNRSLQERNDMVVSDLAITEVVSAAARRKREGALSQANLNEIRRTLLEHSESGVFIRVGLTPATHRQAERFLISLDRAPLRAADALHLALARDADAQTVVTFDDKLRRAAVCLGLEAAP